MKIVGSDIRKNFHELRIKLVNIFERRNVLHSLFTTKIAKVILNRYILCSYRDQNYSKTKKKYGKKPNFGKHVIFLLVNIFRMQKRQSCEQ